MSTRSHGRARTCRLSNHGSANVRESFKLKNLRVRRADEMERQGEI